LTEPEVEAAYEKENFIDVRLEELEVDRENDLY